MSKFRMRLFLEMLTLTILLVVGLGFVLTTIIRHDQKVGFSNLNTQLAVTLSIVFVLVLLGIVYFSYQNTKHFVQSVNEKNITMLQRLQQATVLQKDRMVTLIENLGSGVLLIDEDGFVTMSNERYLEDFAISSKKQIYFKPYYEVIKLKEVSKLVDNVFRTEQRQSLQIEVPVGIETKCFLVQGQPILNESVEWKGVLLVFFDNTELRDLEEIRKDFVANVSHELRTPVTSLKGFAETLLDGAKDDPEALEQFLKIILKESDRLQSLVDDLLELSRIEREGVELDWEEIDVATILMETYSLLQVKASQKQIQLRIHLPDQPVRMEADTRRITQVFINLISNAIAYTPPEGEVDVEITEQEDKVIFSVKDTGIGIEEAQIPRIFERFYRVDKARSRAHGGTGLGLAICKHIIEAHHGEITVESELAKGSTFSVTFQKGLLG